MTGFLPFLPAVRRASRGARPSFLARFACVVLSVTGSAALAASADRTELGRLATGATVSFVRSAAGPWGLEIHGGPAPLIRQPQPVQIEVFQTGDDVRPLSAGYQSVQPSSGGIEATADVPWGDQVMFHVRDQWSLAGAVVTVHRGITVTGRAPGGFGSSLVLALDPAIPWSEVACFAPGAIYGDPTYDGERSPGGTLNYAARRLLMREDILAAPVFALALPGGASLALLNPAPRGDSTFAETRLAEPVMVDARFQFGALGAWQADGGPVELGYRFPGTACLFVGPATERTPPRWYRRGHPIAPDTVHRYTVSFRLGAEKSFPEVTRESWRWAWQALQPVVPPIDLAQMQRVLIDHLAAQVATVDGRTGMPFVLNPITDERQWNWGMIAMGFVGKNLECAELLLREASRDPGPRGQAMRTKAEGIMDSMIAALPTVPLVATGYDLNTGQPWDHQWVAPYLRNASEDMRAMLQAYRQERDLGRPHPAWLAWMRTYADWLLAQQRADGSFPRRWERGSNAVAEPSGTTSYAPVPLLAGLTAETGDPRYLAAAVRAADYVWENWGRRGLFIGGASDNPNITDKEAGMLSLHAFLTLHDATGDAKWLERARVAADFTETWMWIWNLPMPVDAPDAELHWKHGVPTIGLQGITALHTGGVDEYLDWAVADYAKLHRLTGDAHYREVAHVLLHATKSMVSMPGRLYDFKGPGWQQEHWRLGPGPRGRGVGSHRFWLPWISVNHLAGIMNLEESDPELFRELAGPAAP